MQGLIKIILFFPRLMIGQILYVHSYDPELSEFQNDLAFGIALAVVLFVGFAVIAIA